MKSVAQRFEDERHHDEQNHAGGPLQHPLSIKLHLAAIAEETA